MCEATLRAQGSQLAKSANFKILFEKVKEAFGDVKGAGELITYDVTDRIALHLRLTPTNVYLHRGTRFGAQALFADLEATDTEVPVAKLPRPLQMLTSRELETVLCIYASLFHKWRRAGQYKPISLHE